MGRASALGRSLRAALVARTAQRLSAFDQCLAASALDAQPQEFRHTEQGRGRENCRAAEQGAPWSQSGIRAPFVARPHSHHQQQRCRAVHSSSPVGGQKDFYDVLGVSKTASGSEIKKAYYALAKKYHPDANTSDPGAAKKFQEIQAAWEVLKDDEKRAMYDQVGPDAFDQAAGAGPQGGFAGGFPGGASGFGFGGASNLSDIFEGLFGNLGDDAKRGRRRGGAPRSRARVDLSLSFREAALGCTKTLRFNMPTRCKECDGSGAEKGTKPETCKTCSGIGMIQRQQGMMLIQETCSACQGAGETIKSPCGSCRGTGTVTTRMEETVRVPAGVDSGMEMQVQLPHVAGAKGQKNPEILVQLEVMPDPVFVREGQDLHVDVPMGYAQAVLGGSVLVPTLTGQIKLKVPPGTESGHVSIVRGKGIQSLRQGQAAGDQHVHLHVAVPRTLTSRQQRLLQELAEEEERIASGETDDASVASA